MEPHRAAYQSLVQLAGKQGYITINDIKDYIDRFSLPVQNFDWLYHAVLQSRVLVFTGSLDKAPPVFTDEYDNFTSQDYNRVYRHIIALNPSLKHFVEDIKAIRPPQPHEIKHLMMKIKEDSKPARSRMIEMHLRLALRVALRNTEIYDLDIEETVGYACVALTKAVDNYDPAQSGAFVPYAAPYISQDILNGQAIHQPLLCYPVLEQYGYFMVYPVLRAYGCTVCEELGHCKKAEKIVMNQLVCQLKEARTVISQMCRMPYLEDVLLQSHDRDIASALSLDELIPLIFHEFILDAYDVFLPVYNRSFKDAVENAFQKLNQKEVLAVRIRYGFYGEATIFKDIGKLFGVTPERAGQIVSKALWKLRRPQNIKKLKDFHE